MPLRNSHCSWPWVERHTQVRAEALTVAARTCSAWRGALPPAVESLTLMSLLAATRDAGEEASVAAERALGVSCEGDVEGLAWAVLVRLERAAYGGADDSGDGSEGTAAFGAAPHARLLLRAATAAAARGFKDTAGESGGDVEAMLMQSRGDHDEHGEAAAATARVGGGVRGDDADDNDNDGGMIERLMAVAAAAAAECDGVYMALAADATALLRTLGATAPRTALLRSFLTHCAAGGGGRDEGGDADGVEEEHDANVRGGAAALWGAYAIALETAPTETRGTTRGTMMMAAAERRLRLAAVWRALKAARVSKEVFSDAGGQPKSRALVAGEAAAACDACERRVVSALRVAAALMNAGCTVHDVRRGGGCEEEEEDRGDDDGVVAISGGRGAAKATGGVMMAEMGTRGAAEDGAVVEASVMAAAAAYLDTADSHTPWATAAAAAAAAAALVAAARCSDARAAARAQRASPASPSSLSSSPPLRTTGLIEVVREDDTTATTPSDLVGRDYEHNAQDASSSFERPAASVTTLSPEQLAAAVTGGMERHLGSVLRTLHPALALKADGSGVRDTFDAAVAAHQVRCLLFISLLGISGVGVGMASRRESDRRIIVRRRSQGSDRLERVTWPRNDIPFRYSPLLGLGGRCSILGPSRMANCLPPQTPTSRAERAGGRVDDLRQAAWCMRRVSLPRLSPHVHAVIPTVLRSLDHPSFAVKSPLLAAVPHLLSNVPRAELQWYGEPLLEALAQSLVACEESAWAVAVPAAAEAAVQVRFS